MMKFEALKEFMDSLTSWKIPGNSVSVYHKGKEVFNYQSGYASLEKQIPMSGDHMLNLYSCSKVATVVAALQLYEKGLFDLDDPVYSILPEWKEMTVYTDKGIEKAKNTMLIRHLFTMTSGLSYDIQLPCYGKAAELTEGRMNTRTLVKCLAKEPLSFEPGTRWQYSMSHDVLAGLVEVASGERFQDYMLRHVFEPVGITELYYHNEAIQDKMAEQYRLVEDETTDAVQQQAKAREGLPAFAHVENIGKENYLILGADYDSGGAGVTTSVNEYAKFCNALANGGLGSTGERILNPETITLLKQNQLTKSQQTSFDWEHLKGYGYGLGVRTMTNKELSGSTGNLGEFGWGGAAGATVLIDTDMELSLCYAHHMLNPQEGYYQPRLRNVLYQCMKETDTNL